MDVDRGRMAARGYCGSADLTLGLVLHAMFGANGMVVYQQKRAEKTDLKSEVERLQKENDQYVDGSSAQDRSSRH